MHYKRDKQIDSIIHKMPPFLFSDGGKYEFAAQHTFAEEVLEIPSRLMLRILQYRSVRRSEDLQWKFEYLIIPLSSNERAFFISSNGAESVPPGDDAAH